MDLYISQLLKKLHITKASTVQCTLGFSVDQKVLGRPSAKHMLLLPIKSTKTITTLDSMF